MNFRRASLVLLASWTTSGASAFMVGRSGQAATSFPATTSSSRHHKTRNGDRLIVLRDAQIVSPFDDSGAASNNNSAAANTQAATTTTAELGDGPFDLTWENVEMVLEEMRPYLIQDGGNVAISEIDGPVVRLELQGACGTCPSSTQTLKMGLERGLMEKIPEIQEVVQTMPEGPELNEDQINVVLDGVRPFLQVAGGTIDVDRIEGLDGLQPAIWLDMQGSSASLNSVKLEIAQRLQRHFMMAGLRVEWVGQY